MKLACGLLLLSLAFLSDCSKSQPPSGPYLDPSFATLIPADTNLLAGISVDRLVQTPIYKQYLAGFPLPGVEKISQLMHQDPEKHLWQVLLVSNGKDSFLLGRGSFTNDLGSAHLGSEGAQRFDYKGLTFFGDEQNALMMVSTSTAVVGSTDVLRRLIDQRDSMTAPPQSLMALMPAIPRQAQIWAVTAGGNLDLPLSGNLANAKRVFSSLSNATLYFDLSTGVKGVASGLAVDQRAADDVYGALATLLAFAKSGKNQTLLQNVQLTKTDRRITAKLDGPPELLGLLLKN